MSKSKLALCIRINAFTVGLNLGGVVGSICNGDYFFTGGFALLGAGAAALLISNIQEYRKL